ncbi:uncharacterized protein BDV17DRAFT_14556 [Aspergillus undulatus]|uniref:uncharacterized protein n=1 Tax=Aspergillus undulatus TaxID=1810928 RepID=UPI003CCD26D4
MFGNEVYPSWLTRDWDYMKYLYDANADAASGEGHGHVRENSPEEIAHYREKYQEIINKISGCCVATKRAYDSLSSII